MNKINKGRLCVLIVVLGIYSSIFLAGVSDLLASSQNVQAIIFLTSMFLLAGVVVWKGWFEETPRAVWATYLGLLALVLMTFLRLGMAERSHMIEYSLLTLCIYYAFRAELPPETRFRTTAVYTFFAAFFLGCLDEGLQYFVPHRVGDPADVVFNGAMAFSTLAGLFVVRFVRNKFRK